MQNQLVIPSEKATNCGIPSDAELLTDDETGSEYDSDEQPLQPNPPKVFQKSL
jgi:hypothetical protein